MYIHINECVMVFKIIGEYRGYVLPVQWLIFWTFHHHDGTETDDLHQAISLADDIIETQEEFMLQEGGIMMGLW